MKKSTIIIFGAVGSIFGFSIHLAWHYSARMDLFSTGPHVTQGIIYALTGMVTGIIFYLIVSNFKKSK